MYSTKSSQIVFKFCLLNSLILLTASNGLYRLLNVHDLSESRSVEDQQAQHPEYENVGTDTAESEFRRIELLKKSLLKQLNMDFPPNVTQSKRTTLGSPVIKAFLEEYKIDLKRHQNEKDDVKGEMTSQTLLITAKQPPFTTVTSFQNWFYFDISANERMNFRVKSANIWFYVKNTSSSIASTTVKLDVMQPYVNQTSDEVVYIPVSHSSEILNLNERKNSETWKYISITSLAENWLRDPTTNFGVKLYTIDVMNLIATGLLPGEEEYTPFLEVKLVSDYPRHKRNAGNQQRCQQPNITNGCCLQDFQINFHDLGWDWIIFPESYNAKTCIGECSLQSNNHNSITQRTSETNTPSGPAESGPPNQPQNSCVPTQYASLNQIYFDPHGNIIYSEVPDMVVMECGCE